MNYPGHGLARRDLLGLRPIADDEMLIKDRKFDPNIEFAFVMFGRIGGVPPGRAYKIVGELFLDTVWR